jgi:hypothetical protein
MFVWQVPVMLLNFAILLFVGGVVGMLRDRAMRAVESGGGLESDDVKVRILRCLAWLVLMTVDCCCCGVFCGIRVRELHAWDALPLLSDFSEYSLSVSEVKMEGLAPKIQRC